ncbi:MAG: hypothetical protein COY53_06010 [Elusimicrobia bacterium CG_4_10_14_0_8_um_filter_37_32]|nr:MAG: hypothetical protein COY53_06010 [Elusimicrobia bacterium CG_4_10_14_0_8_um_filter_37_32]
MDNRPKSDRREQDNRKMIKNKLILSGLLMVVIHLLLVIFSSFYVYCAERDKKVHLDIANMYFSSGDYVSALKEYTLLLDYQWSKEEFAGIFRNKGACHENIKQYDYALDAFHQAVSLEPRNWINQLNLASVFEKTGLTEKAIEKYEEVLRLNKENFEARYGLGRIYQKLGLNSRAIENYRQTLIIKPNAEIYRVISKCYESTRDWQMACAMLKQAISLAPNPEDYVHLSFLYSIQNQYDTAIQYLSTALSNEPKSIDVMLHLAAANFKKGNYETTKNLLNVILDMDSKNAVAHFFLGLVLYFEDNVSGSRIEIEKARSLAKSEMLKEYSEYFIKKLN